MDIRMRQLTARVLVAGLSLALSQPLAPCALAEPETLAPLETISEEQEVTAGLEEQLREATSTLDAMFQEIEQSQATLSRLSFEIEQTTARITELEASIAANDQSLTDLQARLADEMSRSYKAGRVSLLGLFLCCDSIESLTSALFYQNKVSQQLTDDIATVRQAQTQLDNERSELELLRIELERQRAEEEENSRRLSEASDHQRAYVDQLNDEIKTLLEQERLRKAEESRRAAEEALAAAARELAELEDAQLEAERLQELTEQEGDSLPEGEQPDDGFVTVVPTIDDELLERPLDAPEVAPHVPSQASASQRSIAINAALSQLGVAYEFCCEEPGVGFDCNGLVHWSWGQAGVDIPYPSGRTMYGQFQWLRSSGHWVETPEELLPGDLVFYSQDEGETIYHVALYIGNEIVVHAAGYQWGVIASPLDFCTGFCGGGSPL